MTMLASVLLFIAAGLHAFGSRRAAKSAQNLSWINVYAGAIGTALLGAVIVGMDTFIPSREAADHPMAALEQFAVSGTAIVGIIVAAIMGFWALLFISGVAVLSSKAAVEKT